MNTSDLIRPEPIVHSKSYGKKPEFCGFVGTLNMYMQRLSVFQAVKKEPVAINS